MKILPLEHVLAEMKKKTDGVKNRLDIAEQRFSELEHRQVKPIQNGTEEKNRNREKKNDREDREKDKGLCDMTKDIIQIYLESQREEEKE